MRTRGSGVMSWGGGGGGGGLAGVRNENRIGG